MTEPVFSLKVLIGFFGYYRDIMAMLGLTPAMFPVIACYLEVAGTLSRSSSENAMLLSVPHAEKPITGRTPTELL
jgi:hypothetical protein